MRKYKLFLSLLLLVTSSAVLGMRRGRRKEHVIDDYKIIIEPMSMFYKSSNVEVFSASTGEKMNAKTIRFKGKKFLEIGLIKSQKVLYVQYPNYKIELFSIYSGQRINPNQKILQAYRNKIYDYENLYLFRNCDKTDLLDVRVGKNINIIEMDVCCDKIVRFGFLGDDFFYVYFWEYGHLPSWVTGGGPTRRCEVHKVGLYNLNSGGIVARFDFSRVERKLAKKFLHISYRDGMILFATNEGFKCVKTNNFKMLSDTILCVFYYEQTEGERVAKEALYDMLTGEKLERNEDDQNECRKVVEIDRCVHDRSFKYVRYDDGEIELFDAETNEPRGFDKDEIDNRVSFMSLNRELRFVNGSTIRVPSGMIFN